MADLTRFGLGNVSPLEWLRRRLGLRMGPVMCTAVLMIMLLVILYPMSLLVYSSFLVPQPDGTTALAIDNWINSWSQAGMGLSIYNTVKRVIITEIIAFPAALLIVWLVIRTDLPGKQLIENFFWIAFFLPALPVLMGWILLFDPEYGLVNQALMALFGLEKAPFNIYTFSGMVFAHLDSVVNKESPS